MSFEPIKRILSRVLPASPASKELQIARVFDGWQQTLLEGWGAERAACIIPVSFSEGALKVETTSPSAKQMLLLELPRLKNELNRHLGALVVRSIIVARRGF